MAQPEQQSNSLLFNLEELRRIEEERVEAEKKAVEEKERAAEDARLAAARSEVDALRAGPLAVILSVSGVRTRPGATALKRSLLDA